MLSNSENAETVSWLAGVPLLVLFCLFLAGISGMFDVALAVVALIGALMTLYLMDVDRQLAHSRDYLATCDLAERVSCTEALKAPSASLVLRLRNTTIGLVFYMVMFACVLLHTVTAAYLPVWVLFVLSVCGTLASVYLLQLSLVVLQIACPLCMGLHLVNFSLLWLSWGYSEQVRW